MLTDENVKLGAEVKGVKQAHVQGPPLQAWINLNPIVYG